MAYQLSIPKDVTGRLKSLEEIFSSLHVKSDGCRKRFVCHLAKVKHFQEKYTVMRWLTGEIISIVGVKRCEYYNLLD